MYLGGGKFTISTKDGDTVFTSGVSRVGRGLHGNHTIRVDFNEFKLFLNVLETINIFLPYLIT